MAWLRRMTAAFFAIAYPAISCTDTGPSGGGPVCMEEGMVTFDWSNGELCIDALEVSNSAFAEFLNRNGNVCVEHDCMYIAEAGAQISLDGGSFIPADGFGDFPVVQVSFHGAQEYCAAREAFLCPNAAWAEACGGPSGTDFPYGNDYDSSACNGSDAGYGSPVATGSLASCEGGLAGLFDMSGNVYEWTDSCADSECVVRGGSFGQTGANLACGGTLTMDGPSGHGEDLGFRCCGSVAYPL